MKNESVYIRFLNLAESITCDTNRTVDDLTTLRLLEVIAIACIKGNPLTVTDALALNEIASSSTLHQKLTRLLDAGLIKQDFSKENRRTKYIMLTDISDNYFEQLGVALVFACQESN